MVPIRTSPVRYDTFQLAGGLDLITPTLSLPPGVARDAQNFEVSTTGGYSRISGYERFDGRKSPSTASFTIITLSSVAGVSVGDTIKNLANTVNGVVAAIEGNNVIYTKAVGTFTLTTSVYIGVTLIGTVTGVGVAPANSLAIATYAAAASDIYRADIAAVPGSGPIRGVAYLGNTVYAWRDNVGATAMAIYKSSATGWTSIALGWELPFTGGTNTAIAPGDTVVGANSGATGVVARVVLQSGTTWSGGSGRLILSSTTGTFVNGEHLNVSNKRADCAGAATAITLQPGGRVETVTANMGGAGATNRLYGADGANRGFEFDGTVYVPIKTGMSVDTPLHVSVHKNYLFFSFGSSVQYSGLGTPYVWTLLFGAGELVMPETVTCFQSMPGDETTGSLAIYGKNNTFVLYGTTSSQWNLVPYDRGTGATAYTVQTITDAYGLDDRGVMSLRTSRAFGNFNTSALTLQLRPFIQSHRGQATASGVSREKSQYRVFYGDGFGLYVTIANGRLLGSMPVYFPNPVDCWCEGESSAGSEVSFFGSDNGYVYQMETGPDFDGAAISAYLRLNYASEGNARVLKRYRRASLEITGSGYAAFDFGYSLGYGSSAIDQPPETSYAVPFSGSFWDSFVWDAFIWDGQTLFPAETQVDGTAENIAMIVNTNSRLNQPFTINSITLHYSPRRGIR